MLKLYDVSFSLQVVSSQEEADLWGGIYGFVEDHIKVFFAEECKGLPNTLVIAGEWDLHLTPKVPSPTSPKIRKVEQIKSAALTDPVSVLGLAIRVSNAMRANSIETIRQLVSYTGEELLKFRNLGPVGVLHIEYKLAQAGFSLREEESNAQT